MVSWLLLLLLLLLLLCEERRGPTKCGRTLNLTHLSQPLQLQQVVVVLLLLMYIRSNYTVYLGNSFGREMEL